MRRRRRLSASVAWRSAISTDAAGHECEHRACCCAVSVRLRTLLYMTRLSVSEARAKLPDALRTRRAKATIRQARQVGDLLAAAGQQPLASAGLSAEWADELVRTVREARDRL